MHRLTVGARVAIRMHSETGNIQQLRHDLRNGPNHVFGDHRECNPAFCKLRLYSGSSSDGSSSSSDSDSDNGEDRQDDQTLTAQFEDIIQAELDDEPTATEVHDIHIGPTTLHSLPDGLLEKVKACGDRLVMLSAQLITNETSNLAECYMSIRSIFDGGKQYNRVQSGSFEGRCYAAGMRVQAGPTWQLETVEHILGEAPGKVSLHTWPHTHTHTSVSV